MLLPFSREGALASKQWFEGGPDLMDQRAPLFLKGGSLIELGVLGKEAYDKPHIASPRQKLMEENCDH
jgi:hypothetical protein